MTVINNDTHKCSKCGVIKIINQFPSCKSDKRGYISQCKQCQREAWHARKPKSQDIYEYPRGFVLDAVTVKELFTVNEGGLFWAVNHGSIKKGDRAGSIKGNARVSIQGKRRRVGDVIELWETGEVKEKTKPICMKKYHSLWMKEIKSVSKGFNWSYIWYKEKARRKGNEKYQAMSADKRKLHNKKSVDGRDRVKRAIYRNKWKEERRANDPVYRMVEGMRSRLSSIVKGVNIGGANKLVGCSNEYLKGHLTNQFTKGMTWDNYGSYWHVDHIIPVSSFDHTRKDQVKQCWHFSNLQPLGAEENMMKSNNITKPQLKLCL